MKTHAEYFNYLTGLDCHNRQALHAVLALLPEEPKSFLDLGCGSGALVTMMSMMLPGSAMGIDLYQTGPLMIAHDLQKPLDLGRRFDLVLCWEVAEHLSAQAVDTFCRNVAIHVGRWLVFTAAHPEQGGEDHINEQTQEYWREKLWANGLEYDKKLTKRLRAFWVWATGPCHWLPQNVQVFGVPEKEKTE